MILPAFFYEKTHHVSDIAISYQNQLAILTMHILEKLLLIYVVPIQISLHKVAGQGQRKTPAQIPMILPAFFYEKTHHVSDIAISYQNQLAILTLGPPNSLNNVMTGFFVHGSLGILRECRIS